MSNPKTNTKGPFKMKNPHTMKPPSSLSVVYIFSDITWSDAFCSLPLSSARRIQERKAILSGLLELFGPFTAEESMEIQLGRVAIAVVPTDPSGETEFLGAAFLDFLIECQDRYSSAFLHPADESGLASISPIIQPNSDAASDAESSGRLLERIAKAGGMELGFTNTDQTIVFQACPTQPRRSRQDFMDIEVGRADLKGSVITDHYRLIGDPDDIGELKPGDTIQPEDIEEEPIERRIATKAFILSEDGVISEQINLFDESRPPTDVP
ncbi:MAG: hypothetical protein QM769_00790 [Pseudoxanthomonas sp.]